MGKLIRNVSIIICLGFAAHSFALHPNDLQGSNNICLFTDITVQLKNGHQKSIGSNSFVDNSYVYCTRCRPPKGDGMQ
jgi:hypothetical protein